MSANLLKIILKCSELASARSILSLLGGTLSHEKEVHFIVSILFLLFLYQNGNFPVWLLLCAGSLEATAAD